VIRIGPLAGRTRTGKVFGYPTRRPKGFQKATYLAHYFETVEINSTPSWGPLEYRIARNRVRRVSNNPGLRITAKLFRGFTHERNAGADDERQFKAGIDPLVEAGRLGALLLAFSLVVRERRRQLYICATGSAASAVIRWPSKCNIRARNQRAISDPIAEPRDRTLQQGPAPVCEVHRAERAGDILGRVHSPPWPQLPEQVHGKPTDWRPLSNDLHPSTLEVLYELRIDSMSSQNLYLDELDPWIEREDHCRARAGQVHNHSWGRRS
jgi:uncharacterized protein YecE (DUF72 family)